MAGDSVVITVEGDVQHRLDRIAYILAPKSLGWFLGFQGHEVIQSRLENRFASEGDDATGPWAALKYPTQVARRQAGLGDQHPINVRTGRLKDWLVTNVPQVEINGAGAEYIFPGASPVDSQTMAKFVTAQMGANKPPTVPRPVLSMSQTDMALMVEALGTWFLIRMEAGLAP